MLKQLRGVRMPAGFDPTTGLAILDEGTGTAAFVCAESITMALAILGLDVSPEPEWWRPGRVAVLLRVDGWLSIARVRFLMLAQGGTA